MPKSATSGRQHLRGVLQQYLQRHRDPRTQQAAFLHALLRRNADTVFGRQYGFASIKTPQDYQRRVPIQKWETLESLVDRICRGEQNVLTAEPVILFHQTNGTTGKNKLIPVTARCHRLQTLGYRMWVYKALLDNPGMLKQRAVGIVSANHAGRVPCGIPFGYVSGNVFTSRMPAMIRKAYAFPYEVIEIPDPEVRRYTLMRLALQRDCSFVFTGNPGALLLLFELADKYGERIIRDIHDGTLACAAQIPAPILARVQPFLKSNVTRAQELSALRQHGGKLRPVDYWPGLAVVACWLAGTVGRFSHQLPEWIGSDIPLRDVGYMSSEGTFSIPQENNEAGGLLSLHAAFFEFVPVREYGRPGARALLAHEVDEDNEYQVILTTSGGLYRYAINDIVRVVGWRRKTPLIQFLHKGENVKNIAGEMLNADQVLSAVAAATREFGFAYRHLQVKADLALNRYVFHFEPLQRSGECTPARLAQALERELGRASEMYLGFRDESALESCTVRFMRAGWFDTLMAEASAKGLRESQFKAALLVDAVDHEDMVE